MTDQSELKVSVLVTSYNGSRFIEEQLESIAAQTHPVQQVLICDDGSTDGTLDIVEAFVKRHGLGGWTARSNTENLGPAANVLCHLKDMDGDVVFLADQDDVWYPEKVSVMARRMAEDDSTAMLVCGTRTVDQDGREEMDARTKRSVQRGSRIHGRYMDEPRVLEFVDFLGSSTIPLHAMCVRGEVVRDIGKLTEFPELNRSVGADWFIGAWSSLNGRCLIIPEVLMSRRVHDGNISLAELRKSTVLTATRSDRLAMLTEARDAHRLLLDDGRIGKALSKEERGQLATMVEFLDRRAQFVAAPSPVRAAALFFRPRQYSRAVSSVRLGLRAWIADVMYAWNLNWRLRGKR